LRGCVVCSTHEMIPVADAIHYWRQVLPGYRQLQHDLLFEMSEA
jgi:hypothetical protein